jgi:toxin FitB
MLLVLDSNVISELMKPQADAAVLNWFLRNSKGDFATTAINQAEILSGLALLPEGKRKRAILAAANAIWQLDLKQAVLPFDASCTAAFADILRRRTLTGRPISFADAAIAAICLAHKAGIVTRDTAGFADTGVKVLNPWA